VIPLQIHRGNQVVSGKAWRLYKKAYLERDFSDFWLEASLDFSIHSFYLFWFFLQREDYVKASNPRPLVKMKPLSPESSDYNFAYASDTAEYMGHDPGHIIELPIEFLAS
jgi:hypothetical protein